MWGDTKSAIGMKTTNMVLYISMTERQELQESPEIQNPRRALEHLVAQELGGSPFMRAIADAAALVIAQNEHILQQVNGHDNTEAAIAVAVANSQVHSGLMGESAHRYQAGLAAAQSDDGLIHLYAMAAAKAFRPTRPTPGNTYMIIGGQQLKEDITQINITKCQAAADGQHPPA